MPLLRVTNALECARHAIEQGLIDPRALEEVQRGVARHESKAEEE